MSSQAIEVTQQKQRSLTARLVLLCQDKAKLLHVNRYSAVTALCLAASFIAALLRSPAPMAR